MLERHHVVQPGLGVEGGRHPVRRADNRRTDSEPSSRRLEARNPLRPAILADAGGPIQGLHERLREEHRTAPPIEDIEEPVAVRLQQDLPLLSAIARIDGHDRLHRVPVVEIVRRELVVPSPHAGLGVESDDRVRPEVVALPLGAVVVGTRVPGCPQQQMVGRVVPIRSATLRRTDARWPCRATSPNPARLAPAPSRSARPLCLTRHRRRR